MYHSHSVACWVGCADTASATHGLTREFPERADVLFARNEAEAKARYEHLTKLISMYDE